MPTFGFKDRDGQYYEKFLKIAEVDDYLKENPGHIKQVVQAPALIDPVRLGRVKVDNGFREVLHRIAERTPGGSGLKDRIR
jgi:hypothetical protein